MCITSGDTLGVVAGGKRCGACVSSLWRNNVVCRLCAPPIIAALPESPAKNAVFRLYSALYGAIHKKLFHVKHFAFAAYSTDYGLLAALSAANCFT